MTYYFQNKQRNKEFPIPLREYKTEVSELNSLKNNGYVKEGTNKQKSGKDKEDPSWNL